MKRKILRHNKKRNTSILHECLVLELTDAIIKKDDDRSKLILSLLKEFFKQPKPLAQELTLYNTLRNSKNLNKHIAEKVLLETKRQYDLLNKTNIYIEQSRLISKINKLLSPTIFNRFVTDYKNLATISQIFSNPPSLRIQDKVLLEQEMISRMSLDDSDTGNNKNTEKDKKINLEPVDKIVFKVLIEKFEEKYKGRLIKEQKDLISSYITSFADNGFAFKLFLNEEIGRLRGMLKTTLNEAKEIVENGDLLQMTQKLGQKLEEFREKPYTEKMIVDLLKIQEFINEALKK